MSLRQKTISGFKWTGFSQIAKQVIQLVFTIVLARLLSPSDFGLIAMGTVFTGFAALFAELGVSSALIQKKDIDQQLLSSAFWLNILVGILLMLTFIALAPLIAAFYGKPKLTIILQALSLNFLLGSLSIIQQTILTKEMNFKPLMIRDIMAQVIAGSTAIVLAYRGYGIWSLVYQSLVYSFLNTFLVWSFSGWRPSLYFSWHDMKGIFNFSANITGFRLINYFSRNVDNLLIGKFLGAEALGIYNLAYKLMLYPLNNITWVISKVIFPAFSRIQDDLPKIRLIYLRMVKAISLITFPLMMFLFVVTPEFVELAYGPKWMAAIPLIRVLCICGIIQSVGSTTGNIRLSKGEAGLHLKLGIANAVFSSLSIIVAFPYGLLAVTISYTIFSWIWYHVSAYISLRLINVSLMEFVKESQDAYVFCAITVVVMFAIKSIPLHLSTLFELILMLFLGFVLYGFLLYYKKYVIWNNNRIQFPIFKTG
jgi:O-antigen/teichoic acid export membrane protein